MTLAPAFSADAHGVVRVVGWGDPGNILPTGTTSVPVALDDTRDEAEL